MFSKQVTLTVLLVFITFFFHGIRSEFESSCVFKNYADISKSALKRCKNVILDNLAVPGGETLKLNLAKGTNLTFRGNTSFGFHVWSGFFISIKGENLVVKGEPGSVIDGQGQLYWDGNGQWGSKKPQLLTIKANNSLFENITVLNAPKQGITIQYSNNVEFRHWLINNSFGDEILHPDGKFGHNTDGFAIKESNDVYIHHCDVLNQDDCVVVGSGKNLYISNMYCHNSHGLSVSTGLKNGSISHNTINNLTFCDSFLDGGENGIHVKSRKNGGHGSVSNVIYRNIEFRATTKSGINIQQNYINTPDGSPMDPIPNDNVPFVNFTLENIYGTVTETGFGVYLNCADDACLNFIFKNVTVVGGGNNTCNIEFPTFKC